MSNRFIYEQGQLKTYR